MLTGSEGGRSPRNEPSCHPISRPVGWGRSAAALDEMGLWEISLCMAGQLVCVSVWGLTALALI